MNAWRFLPLCPDDLDAVVTIESQSFDHPWERSSITGELDNPQSRAFVLLRKKHDAPRDVGAYIFLRILVDEAHILKIATEPGRRRRGLAAHLTQQALSAVCREGCRRALLEVRASNYVAIRFYNHLGFETIGKRKRYYGPTDGDALVMAKQLEEAS